ncbi:MAG TPA: FliA/WhiG family RNA polymerase sigma factor [Anaeromyxobacter sp.]|nr:FliA/WhiG family RNA polymerase sigma factor [Anaeromyxobacter sp.]
MHRALAQYVQSGASEAALIARHGALIDRCARRLAARSGHIVSPEDLWSAGAMGLLEAAQRFDAGRDVRFETYAEHRIRGAMLDEMRRMDHLPRRLRADVEKVESARSRLAQQLGRDPETDEVAEALKADPQDVAELLQLLAPHLPINAESASSPEAAIDEALSRGRLLHLVTRAVEALPERLQILLALYYDEELTYREIARILGVSEPRVCQLHSEAVKKLRAHLIEHRVEA